MPKLQHTVKLVGYTNDGLVAKTHQADSVKMFQDQDLNFSVSNTEMGVKVSTNKGIYILSPHGSIENLWTGVCGSIKVHFTKKKVVAQLIYWA